MPFRKRLIPFINKHVMRKYLFFTLIAFASSGCTLSDVEETGEPCPKLDTVESTELSYIKDKTCTKDSCSLERDFSYNFAQNVCPIAYPKCAQDKDSNWYCTTIACKSGEHVSHGICVKDTVNACSSDENNCEDSAGWKNGDCIDGRCVPSECKDKYELRDSKCQAKEGVLLCPAGTHFFNEDCVVNSVENCGAHDRNCEKLPGWKTGVCSTDGNCIALSCEDWFELDNNQCVAINSCPEDMYYFEGKCASNSTQHCGGEDRNCAELEKGWLDGDCINSRCVPSICQEGYCLNIDRCENGSANINACGITGNACITCNSNQICEQGSCIDNGCPSNYHVYADGCEENSEANCGGHDVVCNAKNIPGSTQVACEDGLCKAISCSQKYHPYSNGCEENSIENCGEHEKVCQTANVPGSTQVECSSGICLASMCSQGHVYNGTCEADDNNNCGSHGTTCTTANVSGSSSVECSTGVCKATACASGHLYNSKCEPDDVNNCGRHGAKCSTDDIANSYSVDCSNGTCVPTKCNNYYHVYEEENACEKHDINNCGEHDKICKVTYGTKHSCNNAHGKCQVTQCTTGYTPSSDKTKCVKS